MRSVSKRQFSLPIVRVLLTFVYDRSFTISKSIQFPLRKKYLFKKGSISVYPTCRKHC